MKLKVHIVCVILLLVMYQTASSADVSIQLNESSTLNSLHYSLKDVAKITDDDKKLQAKISTIHLGKAPRPGYVAYITQRKLNSIIERVFPGLTKSVNWSGPATAKISVSGAAFPGNKVASIAQEYLERRLRQQYGTIYTRAVSNIDSLVLPFGNLQLSANLPRDYHLSRRMVVWVDVEIDNVNYQSIPVWFDVSVFSEALVAKESLDKYSRPTESDFVSLVLDITSIGGLPVGVHEPMAGLRMTKSIGASTVLTTDMLEITPLIAKGQEVTVYAGAGKVNLSTIAIALHDGAMLQRISVQHPKNKTHYSAVVIGQGLVRVD